MRALKIALLALNGLRRSPLRVTLTTLGVTFATGALVTMIGLALGVQRQVETPFRALALLNNIQVKRDDDGGKKGPPLDDAAIARFEELPGVSVAYPDAHVKGIVVRYGEKKSPGIGLAMPREAALVNFADEIIVAGAFFDESDQPEVILGVEVIKNLGFKTPQEAIGAQVAIEASTALEDGAKSPGPAQPLKVTVVGVYRAPALMQGTAAQQGIILPVELMKKIPSTSLETDWKVLTASAARRGRAIPALPCGSAIQPAWTTWPRRSATWGTTRKRFSASCNTCGGSSWRSNCCWRSWAASPWRLPH